MTRRIALAMAAVLPAPTVAAEERAPVMAALEWKGAVALADTSCPDGRALEAAVEVRLGRKVFVPRAEAEVVVEGDLRRREGGPGWQAALVMRSREGAVLGTRELATEVDRCAFLEPSLALVVALMVDFPRERIALHIPPPPRTSAWHLEVQVSGITALSLLPGRGAGIEVGMGVQPSGWPRIDVQATYWREARADVGVGGTAFSARHVGILPCPLQAAWRRVELLGCAGFQIGGLAASGFGFDQNRERERLFLTAAGRVGVALRVKGPLRLHVAAGGGSPLVRDRFFFVDGQGVTHDVYRMPAAFGFASAGLGLELR